MSAMRVDGALGGDAAAANVTAVLQPAGAGGLQILERVGVGAHGVSYLAESASLGAVELWRLRPGVLTPELRRRLVLLRSIAHPHLLPVLEIDEAADPPHVFVRSGARWHHPAAFDTSPEALQHQLAGLLGALAEAHRLDVVHGDLGPEQVGRTESGDLLLDLTGLRLRSRTDPLPAAPGRALGVPSAADDVWALAALAQRAPAGAQLPLSPLLDASVDVRLSAHLAAARLRAAPTSPALPSPPPAGAAGPASDALPPAEDAFLHGVPRHLGAYELLSSIGAGGMGRVFRARDLGGGGDVAVKVLMPRFSSDRELVARFQREARVLARLQTPHVARFLAANDDGGFHYLVMELVDGSGADRLVREAGKLSVDVAVGITCDVARALAEVHALGLVHRDVKPANVLVTTDEEGQPTARLCDFGIARPAAPDARDQLTTEGAPGTPSYMSPEQVEGATVDARSDVYALGATLFALLTGRPPFVGPAHFVLIAHVTEPPPVLSELDPSIPPAVSAVVARSLEKDPASRYPSASEMLEALLLAWRGEDTSEQTLPQPLGLSGEPRVYEFRWELSAEPEQLWPHVSNTDRLNRAAGLDEIEWIHDAEGGQVHTEGHFRAVGMELRWKENPFEWVAPERLGVVREYTAGPFLWLRSLVTMVRREGGGTELRHRIELRPRHMFGRAVASIEIGLRLRRGLGRVYERIDLACAAAPRPGAPPPDPFEGNASVAARVRADIEVLVRRALAAGGDLEVLQALAEDVASAPAPQLARIRPRAWAKARGLGDEQVLGTFLLAASEGLLELQWDLLCPVCRIASTMESSLAALREHGRCEACNLDYELDLAGSVELVFRASPSLRDVEVGVYCIGGPAHSPHVVAQVRLASEERFSLDLQLPAGRYRVAGRGLPQAWVFVVDERAPFSTWDLPLRAGAQPGAARSLAPGRQRLLLSNDLGQEVLVRVERDSARHDAVTAADAASHARFRDLFPDQVLAPSLLIAISNVTLLFAQVADALARYESDEGMVHAELMALAAATRSVAAAEGGAVVRLQGDGVMAVFSDRTSAVRAARSLWATSPQAGVVLHAGPARMTTIGGRLDYFGRTIHVAESLGQRARPGDLLVGEPILSDPALVNLVHEGAASLGFLRVGSTLAERLVPISAH